VFLSETLAVMADNSFSSTIKTWISAIVQGVLSTIAIALIPGAFLIYLARLQSVWTTPLLIGLGGTMMAAIIICAARLVRSLPNERVIPTTDNIEKCVRDWLDNFRYGVKNDPIQTAHFRFVVTTDGGRRIIVGRVREEFSDYVTLRADIKPTEEELALMEKIGEYEKQLMIMDLQLEMARAQIGYSGLETSAGPFYLFRRIPITRNLTEHEFIAAMDAVDAAVNSISIVFRMASLRWQIRLKETTSIAKQA
jgi:hypothetical protein